VHTGTARRILQWILFSCVPLALCAPLAAGSDAQDFFNSGKRAAYLDDCVRQREEQLDVRLDGLSYSLPNSPAQQNAGAALPPWMTAGDTPETPEETLPWFASRGFGLYFDIQNFNRVPFLSDSGLQKSDIQRLQASVLFSMKNEHQVNDHDLRLIAGAHFASWNFKSPVSVSLPETAALGTAGNFYDFLLDVRLFVSPFTAIRAGWMYSEMRANLNGADGDTRIARDMHWIFDIEVCSLLQFRFRMDSQPHPEYWSLSSDFVTLLIKWLARHSGVGFFDYLFKLKSLASERVQAEWFGLPLVTLALQAENYYHDYTLHTRAAGTSNLSYDLDIKKSFPLNRGSRFGLDAKLSVFSPGYAAWHDREWMRELSIGAEYFVVFDNNALGNILFDPLINDAQPDRTKIIGAYYMRGGRFADSACTAFDSGASVSRYGYKIGFWLGLWKAISLDLSYSSSYAEDLRYFAELYDSGVLTLKISYTY